MCGIAGLFDTSASLRADALEDGIRLMAGVLAHRGPDDAGLWIDAGAGVALGHRRLAVIDLSQEGRQPMTWDNSRYVFSYNGEIYNFRSVRAELEREGHRFRGHSDTEVLVRANESPRVHGP